ncbi:hypothetical protein [Allorhizobium sonneratiae]|uniref:hypothetical protein n=1 Tax=Allorhizobium sonneratiae TaxID=2934936 RepID=UPI0020333F5A|nr:hypothetical protein [Allorhizobium sonneratiae]
MFEQPPSYLVHLHENRQKGDTEGSALGAVFGCVLLAMFAFYLVDAGVHAVMDAAMSLYRHVDHWMSLVQNEFR